MQQQLKDQIMVCSLESLEVNRTKRFTMEVVGVNEVMQTESEVRERAQISFKLIFLVLFANLELVESSVNNDREQTSVMKPMRKHPRSR